MFSCVLVQWNIVSLLILLTTLIQLEKFQFTSFASSPMFNMLDSYRMNKLKLWYYNSSFHLGSSNLFSLPIHWHWGAFFRVSEWLK